ncbi:uncharacterized protein C8R40DRAFT_1176903 [Lentinula edodes]|uniref:uncharacterized protein n=1 Tax=Lentinula edodes TaxID=5353 RepID=UPI001E8DA4FB|nr:uncharacterized protein C8R40DRAFT_1176903 [Lentinula edodes]KAH7869241.1 hypothetical protein C8R40DRAFT_1176903 [Lentinula edodes]
MTLELSSARQPTRKPWSIAELVRGRNVALGLATDVSSQRSYNSHLNSYIACCTMHSFPLDPTPDTLSFFIVYMSHHIEPRSVGTYLSAGSVPTRSWFMHRLRALKPDTRWAGQSMRAGGATAMAEDGAPPQAIQAAGRWASDTFQLYIRKNPFVLNAMLATHRA